MCFNKKVEGYAAHFGKSSSWGFPLGELLTQLVTPSGDRRALCSKWVLTRREGPCTHPHCPYKSWGIQCDHHPYVTITPSPPKIFWGWWGFVYWIKLRKTDWSRKTQKTERWAYEGKPRGSRQLALALQEQSRDQKKHTVSPAMISLINCVQT